MEHSWNLPFGAGSAVSLLGQRTGLKLMAVCRKADSPKAQSREGRMSQRENVPKGKCLKGKVTLRLYDLNVD